MPGRSVIPYASRTGTRRNLEALRAAEWRLLLAPAKPLLPPGFRYGLDNGAWSSYTQGTPWLEEPFLELLDRHGDGADFVVAPDIVAGGRRSLELSLAWLPRLTGLVREVLVPVQDGMEPQDLRGGFLGPRVGIFVGGSTEWKLAGMAKWAAFGRLCGAWVHIGRVNSVRRIRLCHDAGATSFDGSSASRYSVKLPVLDRATREPRLPFFPSRRTS